ncbi:MAG: MlaE family lipid ABC transporter permease subunit [Azospirillaceae bacterium]
MNGQTALTWDDTAGVVRLAGRWDIATVTANARLFDRVKPRKGAEITIDLSGIEAMDSAGAWVIERGRRGFAERGASVTLAGVRERFSGLIEMAGRTNLEVAKTPRARPLVRLLNRTGERTIRIGEEFVLLTSFLGQLVVTLIVTLLRPARLRFASISHHIEATGINAVPIVGLMAFLIGVVIAYQGATQLREFGAQIFVVELTAISIFRELGVLITSIVVAGRSGSAFTAQIGTMKVNQEVDAMRTLGLDPMVVLVVPRVIALVITLPLLTFVANLVGVLGGAVIAWAALDISFGSFLIRLQSEVEIRTFFIGMVKAPIFAVIIAMVGCFQGLRVTGSAESVGRRTTQAVVQGIMLVIVLDAGFSVVFAELGI